MTDQCGCEGDWHVECRSCYDRAGCPERGCCTVCGTPVHYDDDTRYGKDE